ncbi:triphosphoribosyl-dephospho-CoA synthase [Geomicrobium halophilum]|uniref:triphosphoribosyl-dephospho-CoA synthase n=1 Tax=Geomicrobium halophilum TaxID=549000 RepID=A0A841PUE9_9BACL|nr:triphosphoribosyl-dephospho-CoA synthase [Geomicrobium halophilum]MBB6450776.1 triphosphoribosyl-dephospho-CoA synthase [Geomicrobium halophilum]
MSIVKSSTPFIESSIAKKRSNQALDALLAEVHLTPKPGLVDADDGGAHDDMNLELMQRSARSLGPTFTQIAIAAINQVPSQDLREEIAAIGREGEQTMFQATGGINTHKGAIWALGLLTAASVFFTPFDKKSHDICHLAAKLASYQDKRYTSNRFTHGDKVKKQFKVGGAYEEAVYGFPHVISIGLPILRTARQRGYSEERSQLHALLAIMAVLNDTCILYRGGKASLETVQKVAKKMIAKNKVNRDEIQSLNTKMIKLGVSPGGSADLLAATIFLDRIENERG